MKSSDLAIRTTCLGLLGLMLVASGCGKTEPPQFHLNMPFIVENDIDADYQRQIADTLQAMFGTPDEPYALPETGLDIKKLKMAAGAVRSYEPGAKQGLYRQHCVHCHGISGDGHGPTARFLDPYPRDYRLGTYKFKSTYRDNRPTEEDLHKILIEGVPGTAMPSFALLPPDEIAALIEYIKYLSMRGQMEGELVYFIVNDIEEDEETGEYQPLDLVKYDYQREAISERLTMVAEGWADAKDNVVYPAEDSLPSEDRTALEIAKSADKGRELFYGTRANCFSCHGPTGLGDGQQSDYNDWNKFALNFLESIRIRELQIKAERKRMRDLSGEDYDSAESTVEQLEKEVQLRQAVAQVLFPPRHAIPRNLRVGMYRGGRRPIDLFWRVHQGIPGTPMPAVGPASPGAQGTLKEEEIWNLVDYVRSLPFEPISQPQTKLPANLEIVN